MDLTEARERERERERETERRASRCTCTPAKSSNGGSGVVMLAVDGKKRSGSRLFTYADEDEFRRGGERVRRRV